MTEKSLKELSQEEQAEAALRDIISNMIEISSRMYAFTSRIQLFSSMVKGGSEQEQTARICGLL